MLLVLFFVPTWAMAQESNETKKEPSLAELARRERERRANIKKEVPVITNATLKKLKGLVSVSEAPAAPSQGETEAEAETEAETETEPEETAEKDLASRKAEFDEARMNLKNAVNRSMVLQLKINDLRNAYFREDDGTTQARIQQQLQETLQEIESNKQEVQAAREALQKLENEARKEGLQPGTIRELVGELPKEETISTSPNQ
ncbi:hypothetical protein MYX78_02490 [Acidobacteria bacterium AH-259-G07]|nr:hypothetical protein [Acidobacteria bacterium AH-259-G07]